MKKKKKKIPSNKIILFLKYLTPWKTKPLATATKILYINIILLSENGWRFFINHGPIRRTNNKYPSKIINTGNGLPINGHSATLGSKKKKNHTISIYQLYINKSQTK